MPQLTTTRKITYITAGAGGMYCGSCIRDNALVGQLQDMGWDITLLPLYTPIRTDDKDRSVDQLFFGGINVYLQQKIPLFRVLPGFVDRWLDSPQLIKRVASGNMNVDAKQLGAMTYSMVKGEDGFQKREVKKLVRWLKNSEQPDLICLTNLLVGGSIPALKREMGVPILVTLQGDDVFLDELQQPWREKVLETMRDLASQVDGFLTFSKYYRDRMVDLLDVSVDKFHITPLGVDVRVYDKVYENRQKVATKGDGKHLGYFARVCPEKGFDLMVGAFIELASRDPNYQLTVGGWLSAKDKVFFEQQQSRIKNAGLQEQFHYLGSPDQCGKLAFFESIDIFCVPARFVEPKGLYLLEAKACGVPVVAPDRGAFPEIIKASQGGYLFKSGDQQDLINTLAQVSLTVGEQGRQWVVKEGDLNAMAEATGTAFLKFLN